MQLCEVRAFGKPVVHFGVDIDRVLRTPWWIDRLVPDALEICSESTGARAGDEHVATELEVDRKEMKILATALDRRDALICRDRCLRVRAEADRGAAEVALMVFNVPTTQLCVRSPRRVRKVAIDSRAHCVGVTDENVSVNTAGLPCVCGITVAGRTIDEHSDRVRAGDLKHCLVVRLRRENRATLWNGQQRCVKTHARLMFLYRKTRVVVHRKSLPLHDEPVSDDTLRFEAAGPIQ